MDRSFLAFSLGLSTLGGLLACPIFPQFVVYLVIPLVECGIVIWLLTIEQNRVAFLLLAAACLLTGCVLHFMPRSNSGGMGDSGILLFLIVFIPCMRYLLKIRTSESKGSDLAVRES